jgi:hypothetical protein
MACFFEIPASTRLALDVPSLSFHRPPSLSFHYPSPFTVSLLPPSLSFHRPSPSTVSFLPLYLSFHRPWSLSSLFLPVLFTFHVRSTCRYAHGVLTYLALLITFRVKRLLYTSSHGSIDMAGEKWIPILLLILPSRYQKGLTLIHGLLLLIVWTLTQGKMKVFLVLVSSYVACSTFY